MNRIEMLKNELENKELNFAELDNVMLKHRFYSVMDDGITEEVKEDKSAELVELNQKDKDINSKYHAYINKRDIIDGNIIGYDEKEGNKKISGGTIFHVNKYYEMVNEKRIFEKIPCLWISHYSINKYSPSIWSDGEYILNFN